MIARALLRSARFFFTAGVPSYISYSFLYGRGLFTYGMVCPMLCFCRYVRSQLQGTNHGM